MDGSRMLTTDWMRLEAAQIRVGEARLYGWEPDEDDLAIIEGEEKHGQGVQEQDRGIGAWEGLGL